MTNVKINGLNEDTSKKVCDVKVGEYFTIVNTENTKNNSLFLKIPDVRNTNIYFNVIDMATGCMTTLGGNWDVKIIQDIEINIK